MHITCACLIYARFQAISGTIPGCFGELTKLNVLGIARNYVYGPIPHSMNKLYDLATLFLFSNRLKCNAPWLDQAHGLGVGRFEGITYPAGVAVSEELWKTAQVCIHVLCGCSQSTCGRSSHFQQDSSNCSRLLTMVYGEDCACSSQGVVCYSCVNVHG